MEVTTKAHLCVLGMAVFKAAVDRQTINGTSFKTDIVTDMTTYSQKDTQKERERERNTEDAVN